MIEIEISKQLVQILVVSLILSIVAFMIVSGVYIIREFKDYFVGFGLLIGGGIVILIILIIGFTVEFILK